MLTKLNTFLDEKRFVQNDMFLTPEECKELIKYIDHSPLTESTIYDKGTKKDKNIRNSKSLPTTIGKNQMVDNICKRVARLLYDNADTTHFAIDLIKYDNKGFLKHHQDPYMDGRAFNRVFTAIIYLNNVESGGKTVYPNLNIEITPKEGKLFLFKNMVNGQIDNKSVHFGEETKGLKYILVLFISEYINK